MMSDAYHIPVMAPQCVEGLVGDRKGVYCDLTFGGGGHSRLILDALDQEGRLFGFDQDQDAKINIPQDDRFVFVQQNFQYLKKALRLYGVGQVDGILADLGVSSHQFDAGERGFSIRESGPLDMRMNQAQEKTAQSIVRDYAEEDLADVLYKYGELTNSRKIAAVLKLHAPELQTTEDVIALLEPMVPQRKANQFLARVFQALRIEVNAELEVLESMLMQALEVLKPGGRLVVMSYHSLEDRLVKNFMRAGNFSGVAEKDFFGQATLPFTLITRKPVVPDPEELVRNTRSRSAKLRIAEKR